MIAKGEGGGLFVPSGVTPISTGGLSAADTSNSPPRRRQGGDRLAFDRFPPRARSKEDPLDDPSLLGRDFFVTVCRGATVRKLDHLPTWLDEIFTWPIVAAPRLFPTLLKSLRKLLVSSTRTLTGYTR